MRKNYLFFFLFSGFIQTVSAKETKLVLPATHEASSRSVVFTPDNSLSIPGETSCIKKYAAAGFHFRSGTPGGKNNLAFDEMNISNRQKKSNQKTKPDSKKSNNTIHTIGDYDVALVSIVSVVSLKKTTADSLLYFLPNATKTKGGDDQTEQFRLTDPEHGLKEVLFNFSTKDERPLYQMIFNFDNADTALAYIIRDLGRQNHPTLDDHWVIKQGDNNLNVLAWIAGSKLVVAINLPNSPLADDPDFVLPADFVLKPDEKKQPNNNDKDQDTSVNADITASLNAYFAAANADNNLDDLVSTDGVPLGKVETYYSKIKYSGSEQTYIRKNTAGKWRVETLFTITNSTEATIEYDKQLITIQNLEGLNYRLIKKSELSSAQGKSYLWNVQTADDKATGIVLKLQMYPSTNGMFGIKIEIGK